MKEPQPGARMQPIIACPFLLPLLTKLLLLLTKLLPLPTKLLPLPTKLLPLPTKLLQSLAVLPPPIRVHLTHSNYRICPSRLPQLEMEVTELRLVKLSQSRITMTVG